MKLDVRLAPGVPSWDALGLADPAGLLAGGDLPRGSEVLGECGPGAEAWRVPLPGTVHADGRRNGKPMGVGTGWLHVTVWRRPRLREVFGARFTSPPSASLAEREWNLLCTLRAAGVPTAEPLGVASQSRAVAARRALLVTRELDGMLPLPSWLERFDGERDRRQLSRALGLFLGKLAATGVRLPALRWSSIVAHAKSGGRSDCAAERIVDLRERTAIGGLELSGLPELALADVRGGHQGRPLEVVERADLLRLLARERPATDVVPRATEFLRVVRGVLGDRATRVDRQDLARELIAAFSGEVRSHA